jgi:hypothetical protein
MRLHDLVASAVAGVRRSSGEGNDSLKEGWRIDRR